MSAPLSSTISAAEIAETKLLSHGFTRIYTDKSGCCWVPSVYGIAPRCESLPFFVFLALMRHEAMRLNVEFLSAC